MPRAGPCSDADERHCHIVVHDYRLRKTGPRHSLAVFKCKVHGGCFTAYPPGHVPYGRQPLTIVSPDGTSVSSGIVPGAGQFADTLFDAALDAAKGRAWRRPVDVEWCPDTQTRLPAPVAAEGLVWSTQVRHLDRVTQLLGLDAPDADARVAFAEILAIDTLVLHEQSGASGYRARGRAVEAVLAAIGDRAPDARLTEAGAKAGLWRIPLRWDAHTKQLRRRPYRGAGTPRARAGPSRAPGDP